MDTYAARLCWNSKRWTRPTGEAAREEHDTYCAANGFGHEEWLFNMARLVDGWKYGFLQPVNKSRGRIEGEKIRVRLYSISREKGWLYVGEIETCEVLDHDKAEAARAEFEERSWWDEMRDDVVRVGGDVAGITEDDPTLLFNVRFKPKHALLYPQAVQVGENDAVRKLKRYTLVNLKRTSPEVEKDWATRVGTTNAEAKPPQKRRGVTPRLVNDEHSGIKAELFDLLAKMHGESSVVMEEDFVDLTLRTNGRLVLVEVKTDSSPRYAVREALGQLLEYDYRRERNGEKATELVVVGPCEADKRDRAYFEHLQKKWKLPFKYVPFRRGQQAVEI